MATHQEEGTEMVDQTTADAPESQGLPPMMVAEARAKEAKSQGLLQRPEEVWRVARIIALLILLIWALAWPIGSIFAHRAVTGVFQFTLGYTAAVVVLAISNALLVLGGGYLLRSAIRLEATAASLGQAVRDIEPALKADAVKTELDLLGGEVDAALIKLAKAEQQIREQVGAIDAATATLNAGSTEGTERLAKERQALIDATKAMNNEADNFARALAERTSSAKDAADAELPDIEGKLQRLEAVSRESAEQFASLREALAESTNLLRETPRGIAGEIQTSADTLRKAQQDLMDESEKLRKLIDDQKDRADSLGRSLAAQSEKLKKRQPVSGAKNLGGSWRRILDKVEEQVENEPPLKQEEPAPTSPEAAKRTPEERRLDRMASFTLALKAQLFGMPTKKEQALFEAGDRQLFTKQILDHDQIELRARLRAAIEGDDSFAEASERFLTDFDQLLAPAMNEGAEQNEDALQDMLRSPMGQLYVAIGTAKGHFV